MVRRRDKAAQRKRDALQPLDTVTVQWPFADPPDTRCYITHRLLAAESVPETVIHGHDGTWEVLDDTEDLTPDTVTVVCLADAVSQHPVIGALAKLPVGWRADMDFDVPEWVVAPADFDEDDDD